MFSSTAAQERDHVWPMSGQFFPEHRYRQAHPSYRHENRRFEVTENLDADGYVIRARVAKRPVDFRLDEITRTNLMTAGAFTQVAVKLAR